MNILNMKYEFIQIFNHFLNNCPNIELLKDFITNHKHLMERYIIQYFSITCKELSHQDTKEHHDMNSMETQHEDDEMEGFEINMKSTAFNRSKEEKLNDIEKKLIERKVDRDILYEKIPRTETLQQCIFSIKQLINNIKTYENKSLRSYCELEVVILKAKTFINKNYMNFLKKQRYHV